METPLSALFPVPWFGEGTTDHADPSYCSISVLFALSAAPTLPTAQDSLGDTKETFDSSSPEDSAPFCRFRVPHVAAAAPVAPALTSTDGTTASARNGTSRPRTERFLPIPPASP